MFHKHLYFRHINLFSTPVSMLAAGEKDIECSSSSLLTFNPYPAAMAGNDLLYHIQAQAKMIFGIAADIGFEKPTPYFREILRSNSRSVIRELK